MMKQNIIPGSMGLILALCNSNMWVGVLMLLLPGVRWGGGAKKPDLSIT